MSAFAVIRLLPFYHAIISTPHETGSKRRKREGSVIAWASNRTKAKKNRLPATEIKESSFFLHFVLLWGIHRHVWKLVSSRLWIQKVENYAIHTSVHCFTVSPVFTLAQLTHAYRITHLFSFYHPFSAVFLGMNVMLILSFSHRSIPETPLCQVYTESCEVEEKWEQLCTRKKIVNKHKKDT